MSWVPVIIIVVAAFLAVLDLTCARLQIDTCWCRHSIRNTMVSAHRTADSLLHTCTRARPQSADARPRLLCKLKRLRSRQRCAARTCQRKPLAARKRMLTAPLLLLSGLTRHRNGPLVLPRWYLENKYACACFHVCDMHTETVNRRKKAVCEEAPTLTKSIYVPRLPPRLAECDVHVAAENPAVGFAAHEDEEVAPA